MTRTPMIGLALVFLVCITNTAEAQRKAPEGAKVFLLSGGQREHHGFREQALYLASSLENTGRFQVTIGEDAAILETPGFRKYDLLIVTVDRRDPASKFTPAQQEAIFEYVRSGHGYVSIHGGDNAPPDWLPTWKEMLGGIYSHTGKPDGKARRGTYLVKIADTSSPITQGLKDFELKDELYYNMQMMPDVKPLATIEFQGTVWPVAWTQNFGKGRVFHTNLGHHGWKDQPKEDPLRDPNLSRLILQGIEWVAAGRLAKS